jgi:hypothetical protein
LKSGRRCCERGKNRFGDGEEALDGGERCFECGIEKALLEGGRRCF